MQSFESCRPSHALRPPPAKTCSAAIAAAAPALRAQQLLKSGLVAARPRVVHGRSEKRYVLYVVDCQAETVARLATRLSREADQRPPALELASPQDVAGTGTVQDRLTWSDLVSSTMPPRNPNNYNGDDEDEEDDGDEDDEDREPAVIREPDEDE
jgi:hypothetical protein